MRWGLHALENITRAHFNCFKTRFAPIEKCCWIHKGARLAHTRIELLLVFYARSKKKREGKIIITRRCFQFHSLELLFKFLYIKLRASWNFPTAAQKELYSPSWRRDFLSLIREWGVFFRQHLLSLSFRLIYRAALAPRVTLATCQTLFYIAEKWTFNSQRLRFV